jgi:hypothetical protein
VTCAYRPLEPPSQHATLTATLTRAVTSAERQGDYS